MSGIQKICPTPEELSSVCSKVRCSEDKCEAVFQSTSNLNMHLIKHHKLPGSALASKKADTQYFCPANSCPYNKDSSKHFAKLKYLKQHYLKVHALKEFVCLKCKKKFSTESFKSLHMKSCGKLFSCTCGSYYNSSEAILTHCKRKGKGHSIVGKTKKVIKKVDNGATLENNNGTVKKTERVIYPKFTSDVSFPIHYIAAIALSELSAPRNLSKVVDKGIQTEVIDSNMSKNIKSNNTSLKSDKKRKNSQQTQTTSGKWKKLKISAQTQTNSDYLKHKAKTHPKTVLRKRKKSMETQTKDHLKEDSFKTKSLIDNEKDLFLTLQNEQKDVNHAKRNKTIRAKVKSDEVNTGEDKARKWLWGSQFFMQKGISSANGCIEAKNELLTMGSELNLCNKELNLNEYSNVSSKNNGSHFELEQGSDNQMFDFNRLCNIETQTEINTFLTECNDDTTFTLCSTTQTQTTDDFDSLLYSNMCTQTCEEVDQLFNFNFVDIETQTAWPDLDELDS